MLTIISAIANRRPHRSRGRDTDLRQPAFTGKHAFAGLARFAVAAILTPLATAPAFAVDVPYSQGTLHFNDANKVTIGPGGDYATCVAATSAFPRGGPGGVIEFLPGNHAQGCGEELGRRGNILITGRLGPNGERPRVTTPTHTNNDGSIGYEPFVRFHSDKPDNIAIQNLDLIDTGGAVSAWDFGGMVIRNVKIDDTNGNNAIKVDATEHYNTQGYKWPSWLEIYDTEVAHGGSYNTRHNIYLGRLHRVHVDGLYTHSAYASHAFKSIARDLTIVNSTFAVSDLSFNDALRSAYLSTTLVDISACATSRIENNNFVGFRVEAGDRVNVFPDAYSVGGSTHSFIDLKRRKTEVGGCDDPKYGTAQANDPAFWNNAAAGGYSKSNTELFQHTIANNNFVNVGQREMATVRNVGTAYMEDNPYFNTIYDIDLPLPTGWFERSVAWLENNTTSGPIRAGEEWTPHNDYPHGAPIFNDGVRVGPTTGDPFLPVQVGTTPGSTPAPTTPVVSKPTPPVVKPTPVVTVPPTTTTPTASVPVPPVTLPTTPPVATAPPPTTPTTPPPVASIPVPPTPVPTLPPVYVPPTTTTSPTSTSTASFPTGTTPPVQQEETRAAPTRGDLRKDSPRLQTGKPSKQRPAVGDPGSSVTNSEGFLAPLANAMNRIASDFANRTNGVIHGAKLGHANGGYCPAVSG